MRKSTRNNLIAIAVIVAVNTIVYYETYVEKLRAMAPVDMSSNAPDFEWQALDGSHHRFSELAGHVTVLHFWASWCGPCRKEFPNLIASADALKGDVTFLTVSGDSKLAAAQEFVASAQGASHPSNVLYAWDPHQEITLQTFQTALFPESIVVDATGTMRRKIIGPVDWKSRPIQDYLKRLKK